MTFLGNLPLSNSYYYAQEYSFAPAFNGYISNSFTASLNKSFNKLSPTLNNPIAAYHFNGNLVDATGNGNDLIMSAGSANYAKKNNSDLVIYFDGTNRVRTSTNTPFIITGALTVQMLVKMPELSSIEALMEFGANGETLATNVLYSYYMYSNRTFYYLHESGSGTNYEGAFATASYRPYEWQLLSFTRNSDGKTNKVFINGKEAGDMSVVSVSNGGTSGQLYIGGKVSTAELSIFYCDSFKIHNIELTAEQIAREYDYCFNVTNSLFVPVYNKEFITHYVSTSNAFANPLTASYVYINPQENYRNDIRLRAILASNGASNTGSIGLYNVTSGSYVHLSGTSISMSVIGTSSRTVTSVNLLNTTNFSSASTALYRLDCFGSGTGFLTNLYGSEILFS